MAKFKKLVPIDRTIVPGTWSDLEDDLSVAIDADGNTAAHRVMVLPYPPLNMPNRSMPNIAKLTINGDGVTDDLTVDGSVTAVDAFIQAPANGDLYIRLASVLIADAGAVSLNAFGSIAGGVTNGFEFFVESGGVKTDLGVPLKTNHDFIRIGTETVGIGGKTDAYQLAKIDAANNDGYSPLLDFTQVSLLGVRLLKGTSDKFGITINDNITSVATFNIIVKGFIRT